MKVIGTVVVPGDKSVSHRALILSALANGTSRVRRILQSADVESTAGALRALGAEIPPLSADMKIAGSGLRGLRAPSSDIDCGNSGTTARLIAGVISGAGVRARIVGDESLSRRPMRRVTEPLEAMGASFEFDNLEGLPLTIKGGRLNGVLWRTAVPSAQVKSAVLLAGLIAGVEVTVEEATTSRDHTERMLSALTGAITYRGTSVTLAPANEVGSLDLTIPGDPSSAAFLLAMGVLAAEGFVTVPDVGVNPTRTGFVSALERMGCAIRRTDERVEGGEPIATLTAAPSRIGELHIGAQEVPSLIDEIPLLACVAAAAGAGASIRGARELRFKETDRIAALALNLRCLGAEITEHDDGFDLAPGARIGDGEVRTFADHRIAMAFGVLAAATGRQITIDDRDCVRISYPGFWTDLENIIQ